MELSNETKDLVRLALSSHGTCVHEAALCYALVVTEVELRRGFPVETQEELEAIGYCITDNVLEGLILKGYVEAVGLDDDGEFLLGLTEAGGEIHQLYTEIRGDKSEDG